MKKLLPLLLVTVLSGCSYDFGFKILIRPRNSIAADCFTRTVEETIPDVKYEGDKKTQFHLHFDFRTTEQFKDKLNALDIGKLERRVGAIESSFRLDGERITEILFSFMYDEKKIAHLSASALSKVKTFAKPYWAALRTLPQQLKVHCGLDSENVQINCTGKLCE